MMRLNRVCAFAIWREMSSPVAVTTVLEEVEERQEQEHAERLEQHMGPGHPPRVGRRSEARDEGSGAGADIGAQHDIESGMKRHETALGERQRDAHGRGAAVDQARSEARTG